MKIDYSQSVNPERARRYPTFSNDGTRDIGNTQSAVLLLRGLDDLTTPEIIARTLEKCGGAGGVKSLERVLVAKDKKSMTNLGFAFAEFSDVQVRVGAISM